jgi:nicotinamidase/pyrazinamidase
MQIFFDVDTQADFMNKDGALYVPGAEDIKSNLGSLTYYAQINKIPIFASLDWHSKNDPEFKVFPPHCIAGTDGAKKIKETAGVTLTFEKQTYDVFTNPYIKKALAGISEVIVYGVATNICVHAAVLGLRAMGIKTYVAEDAIAGVEIEQGDIENSIKEMKEAGAIFVTTQQIIGE